MHLAWILVIGTALLAMALLPAVLAGRPLSYPLVYLTFGVVVFQIIGPLTGPDQQERFSTTRSCATPLGSPSSSLWPRSA